MGLFQELCLIAEESKQGYLIFLIELGFMGIRERMVNTELGA